MLRFALIVLAVLLHGCSSLGERTTGTQTLVRPSCPDEADVFYFPAGALAADRPDLDSSHRKWFSEHLRRMGATSLSCGSDIASEAYRFLWLRTFKHPVAVQIRRDPAGVTIDAVELSGAGGYEPGSALRRQSGALASGDWQKLEDALAKSGFWAQSTNDWSRIGTDGAQWIVEGRRGREYHVVERWSPEAGPYKDLGLLFLQLAEYAEVQ